MKEYPPILNGTPEMQLASIREYLIRLNANIDEVVTDLETTLTKYAASAGASTDVVSMSFFQSKYAQLKAMIQQGGGCSGEAGGYYRPSVSSDGVLSWTPSSASMPSVASANIKGAKGDKGDDGEPGADGYTPQKNVDYFDGEPGADGADGQPGEQGARGPSGVYCGDSAPTDSDVLVWVIPDDSDDGCVYPIGTILHMTTSTSPASLYGGTWEKIVDRFLVGAGSSYELGDTGGSLKHTHEYAVQLGGYYNDTVAEGDSNAGVYNYEEDNTHTLSKFDNRIGQYRTTLNGGSTSTTVSTDSVTHYSAIGNASYTEALPPYKSVNIWERIA